MPASEEDERLVRHSNSEFVHHGHPLRGELDDIGRSHRWGRPRLQFDQHDQTGRQPTIPVHPSHDGPAANVSDVTQAGALLHGQETAAFGDAGYRGVDKREEAQGPKWHVAMQPGKRRALDTTSAWGKLLEQASG